MSCFRHEGDWGPPEYEADPSRLFSVIVCWLLCSLV